MSRNLIQLTLKFSLVIILMTFALQAAPVKAQQATVRAVLFYSPSCPHCHTIITEVLPPLFEKYGDRLEIIGIDVSISAGQTLYQSAIGSFGIPQERLGVPCLIIGDTVLVGSFEIPNQLPGIIERGLENGGLNWPQIPGLEEVVSSAESSSEDENVTVVSETTSAQLTLGQKFQRDLVGNTLSVIVFVGMIAGLYQSSSVVFNRKKRRIAKWPDWIIPLLLILGLFVAGYLSYVEVTQSEAVCGPVGDCNTVQQSPYATLFGVFPIGILGILGYLTLTVLWLVQKYSRGSMKKRAALLNWGLAAFGVGFSIYLTFLEPFVIGATCAWCLSSAVIMTLLLFALTPSAKNAYQKR